MITLQRPDSKVSALMGEFKGIHHGDMVRPSLFTIPFTLGDKKVVLNAFTDHCIETEMFSRFEDRQCFAYDEKDPEMRDLVRSDFLVPEQFDEAGKYLGMLSILRRTDRIKKGYTGYTILPTTECNARCVYCYELDLTHETMSDEIVEQTIRYILATKREGSSIGFHWFGGEPLIGEKIIDRICGAMGEANIDYTSNMISNGSLMTEELAAKAKEDWHLTSVQITLDGREDVYCERKRYVAFGKSPYKAVLKAIHALLDQKIRVSIRLNVDEENIEELMALADELEEEFREDSLVSIYCHGIFAEDGDKRDSATLYEGMAKLSERLEIFNRNRRNNQKHGEEISQKPIDDGNIEWEKDEEDENYYDRRGHIRRYFCMVDSPMAGPVILPNGRMTLCEHIGSVPEVGSVYDEKPFEREKYVERERGKMEKCMKCPLLPVCTDFTGCPTITRNCFDETLAKEKRKLLTLETEDRLPPVMVRVGEKIFRVTEPTREFIEENRNSIQPSYLKADETVGCEEASSILQELQQSEGSQGLL